MAPKRDVEGMGAPEIKYGESMCFVQHVDSGLWVTYAAADAKALRLGLLKRRVRLASALRRRFLSRLGEASVLAAVPALAICSGVAVAQQRKQPPLLAGCLSGPGRGGCPAHLGPQAATQSLSSRPSRSLPTRQAILHQEGHMDDALSLTRCQHEQSQAARMIYSTSGLYNQFIKWVLSPCGASAALPSRACRAPPACRPALTPPPVPVSDSPHRWQVGTRTSVPMSAQEEGGCCQDVSAARREGGQGCLG